MRFTFQSNTIQTMIFPFNLRIPDDFRLRLIDLKVLTPISCDDAFNLRSHPIFNQFSDTVYFRIEKSSADMHSLATTLSRTCANYSPITITIISVTAIVILIIVVGMSIFLYRIAIKRREKRQIPVVMPEGKTYRETQIVMQIEHAGLLKTDLWNFEESDFKRQWGE